MKKKILLALVILLVLGGAAVGALLYNANSIVGRFKPDLERIASTALGSKVTLGDLSVSIIPSTEIRVDKTVVGASEGSRGVELKNLTLKADLKQLLSGKLQISELLLDSPELTFVKDADGVSIEGLPKNRKKEQASEQPSEPKVEGHGKGVPSAPLEISLERFRLANGSIRFKDVTTSTQYDLQKIQVESAVKVEPERIVLPTLSFSAVALDTPLSLTMKELTLGTKSGELQIADLALSILGNTISVLPKVNINTLAGSAVVSSSGISIASFIPLVERFAPAVKQFNASGQVSPKITAEFDAGKQPLTYGATGSIALSKIAAEAVGFAVKDLGGDIKIAVDPASKRADSENLSLSINGQPLTAALKAGFSDQSQHAALESLAVKGFGGTTNLTAGLTLTGTKPFTSDIQVRGLNIGTLLSILPGGNKTGFYGDLVAFDAKLNGILTGDIKSTVAGSGSVDLKNGVLPKINIAGLVINSLSIMPWAKNGGIYAKMGPESQAALRSPDTPVTSLTTSFQLGGGKIRTNNFSLISNIYTLEASGEIGVDTSVDLKATISFTNDFSEGLVRSAPDIEGWLDSQRRLTLPLQIQGKPPALVVIPNIEKVAEIAAKKAVQKGAEKLLDRALGGQGKGKGLGGLFKF